MRSLFKTIELDPIQPPDPELLEVPAQDEQVPETELDRMATLPCAPHPHRRNLPRQVTAGLQRPQQPKCRSPRRDDHAREELRLRQSSPIARDERVVSESGVALLVGGGGERVDAEQEDVLLEFGGSAGGLSSHLESETKRAVEGRSSVVRWRRLGKLRTKLAHLLLILETWFRAIAVRSDLEERESRPGRRSLAPFEDRSLFLPPLPLAGQGLVSTP